MKLKKIIYGFSLAALILAAGTGCRKSQFNINRNTNQPTDSTVTYDVVLPAALHASGVLIAQQWGPIQNWMGYWARSGTYAPNIIEETYEITTGFGNGIWNSAYDNNYDYQIVQTKAATAGAGFYEGIARIMKAHNFQILVDVYGNVPYTQALKGGGNPTPAYDKGLDIYKDLFRQVDTAIQLIKDAPISDANKNIFTNDIIFGTSQYPKGSLSDAAYSAQQKARWVRFANTLKLRWLIHAYAVAAISKPAEMAIINAEGSGFLGVGEDVQIQPGYASDKPNPFFNQYYRTTANVQTALNVYYAANEWGIAMYNGDADPRRSRFYEAGANGYTGVAYGLSPVNANIRANLAGIGPGLYKTFSAPQAIMTAAESFFLQSEARFRGIITSGSSAYTLMRTAVIENMRYLGVTDPTGSYNTYESNNATFPDVDYFAAPLAPGLPSGGLYTILQQKWYALNGINTLEIWTDYRRVPYTEVASYPGAASDHFVYGEGGGYPAGPTISVAPQNTSTKIPVRYLYPQTEYNYNPANVGAEGTVDRYTKIFWDIN